MRIFLLGKHSNRTPLSYLVYRRIAEKRGLVFVDNINNADIIIFGFVIDIKTHSKLIFDAISINPKLRLVVLSEEPLWDTIWSPKYDVRNSIIACDEGSLNYTNLNHFTTEIYNFNKIPYFITTEDKYVIRYSNFLSRNIKYSKSEIVEKIKNRKFAFSCMAEKRLDAELHKFRDGHLIGLSNLRTQVADTFSLSKKCVGKGWVNNIPRQDEVDWHLAKISEFDNLSIVMSAVENTVQENYITEKIFDAYATLSFPLYFSNPNHRIKDLIKNNSALFFETDDVECIVEEISRFQSDWRIYVDNFIEDSIHLNTLFSDFQNLETERIRVVDEIIINFSKILN